MGHLVEGVVEQDPMTDRYVIRAEGHDGKAIIFDLQEALAAFNGKEVRVTLNSFENLSKLAQMVEEKGCGLVQGVQPDELPGVPFNIVRR
jgi:isochorismate hydrolase